jgi:aspartate dehydrogenase
MGLLEHMDRPPLLQVGIVGCGAVGATVARAIDSRVIKAELTAVSDSDEARTQALVWGLTHVARSMTLPGLVRSCRLVVEATNPPAATSIILQALDAGCDLLVTNPAALLPRLDVLRTAEQRGLAVYVPVGCLVGLEALAGVEPPVEAILTVEMPARELGAVHTIAGKEIDPGSIDKPTIIFEGRAAEASRGASPFANMAATLALALPDPSAGRVKLVASPDADGFSYGVQVQSQAGSASSVWQTPPGRLHETLDRATSMAAIAALRGIVAPLKLA